MIKEKIKKEVQIRYRLAGLLEVVAEWDSQTHLADARPEARLEVLHCHLSGYRSPQYIDEG